jgi:hypothetical protein
MKTTVYTVSRNHENLATVRAATPEDAARIYARRVYSRKATAHRTTGTAGLTGYFQAYEPISRRNGGGLTSIGDPFHIFG